MAFPVIFVKSFTEPSAGLTRMAGTPEDSIENRVLPRRFYNFNMVITVPLGYQNQDILVLSDNGGTNDYHMIDRLGNPVLAEQLALYAGTRRCLPCRYDSSTQTVTVLGCITPTNKYIEEWLNPPATTTEASETGE